MLLEGLIVVDFTQLLPGPYATLRLADLGAHVIKIEPPNGDPARTLSSDRAPAGVVFLANNRNKESVRLDLLQDEDVKTAQRLIAEADVVIEGFRPGVAQRLGVGYEQAIRLNPRIIYCSLTGYGQIGEARKLAGHDLNYMAASGMLSHIVDADGHPVVPRFQLADHLGALGATEAILAGLYQREHSGVGCYQDISMTDILMGMMTTHALVSQFYGHDAGITSLSGHVVCYRIYETSDQRFVSLGALELKFWRNFCHAVAHPEWIDAHMSPAIEKNAVYVKLRDLFKTQDLVYWTALGTQADCCMQPVLTVSEALSSSRAKETGVSFLMDTVAFGQLRQVRTMAGGATTHFDTSNQRQPPT